MTQMLLADPATLADIRALRVEVAELKEILRHSQIQPAPEWVSISQAARILECSETTIRRRIDRGEMEAQGAGKARKVRVR